MEIKALKRLKSLALSFNNIGSIASTQKELLQIHAELKEFAGDAGDDDEKKKLLYELSEGNELITKLNADADVITGQLKILAEKNIDLEKTVEEANAAMLKHESDFANVKFLQNRLTELKK